MSKKLLLHLCCAPCGIHVVEQLKNYYSVTGFFYNPNIHPVKEYDFRKIELKKIAEHFDWEIIFGDYNIREWFDAIRGMEKEPERGKRCSRCFHLRLKKTFELAKKKGFDIVASTLSISPYKVTRQINEQGLKLGQEFDIEFLAENFKKKNGYQISRLMAQHHGIQHQDYCGCVFSRVEKLLKTRSKKNGADDSLC